MTLTRDDIERLLAGTTKGAFHVENAVGADGHVLFYDVMTDGPYRGGICSVHAAERIGGVTMAEAKANAALIAAAPELAATALHWRAEAERLKKANGNLHKVCKGYEERLNAQFHARTQENRT